MKDTFFAGFIVTYNRPEVLANTIQKVLNQSVSPSKLWIIDNSEDSLTELLIASLQNPKLIYHRIGYNAGPAYAINVGFSMVAEAGFEWCFWGDDNDPPPSQDCFEVQYEHLSKFKGTSVIGMLGIVGHRFNLKTGVLDRVLNEELENSDTVIVDSIAGGQCKIVNSILWKKGVEISEEIFYGFEELDFDIQVKKLGYSGLVPSSLYRVQRHRPDRESEIERRLLSKEVLWRQYYSTRNLLFIFKKHKLYFALVYLLVRKLVKIPFEFRKGWRFGITSLKYNLLGAWHWVINKYGKQI